MLTLQKETAPPPEKPPRKRKFSAPLIVLFFALVVWSTSDFWLPLFEKAPEEPTRTEVATETSEPTATEDETARDVARDDSDSRGDEESRPSEPSEAPIAESEKSSLDSFFEGCAKSLPDEPSSKTPSEERGEEASSEVEASEALVEDEGANRPKTPVIESFDPAATEAGTRRVATINGAEFAFRYCPPGEFAMGSPEVEFGRRDDERRHKVTLTQGFWTMETELTNEQLEALSGKERIWEEKNRENFPAVYISWNDCAELLTKLNEELNAAPDGWRYALPTEAQWEYACRAGTTGARYGKLDEIAWTDRERHPVGEKKPNAWGLCDMLGNVDEWVADYSGAYPKKDVVDPTGAKRAFSRVFRGGGWDKKDEGYRAANRNGYAPDAREFDIGARFALVPISKGGEPSSGFDAPDLPESETFDLENPVPGTRCVATINDVEFAFRYCPPTTFEIGSSDGANYGVPSRKTTLAPGYWLMETELTQKQWDAIAGGNPSCYKHAQYPVESVSWNDCQKFVTCLNEDLNAAPKGWRFSLPTEIQWERACRAGSTKPLYGELEEIAWHYDNSSLRTNLVAEKKPNAWGFYDMIGNVKEWVADWSVFGSTSKFEKEPYRAALGGDCFDKEDVLQYDYRERFKTDYFSPTVGARLALVPTTELQDGERNREDESRSTDEEPASSESEPDAGARLVARVDGLEIAFRYCPPGEFAMGSPDSEKGRTSDETRHNVTLTKGFWLMETETTREQLDALSGEKTDRFDSEMEENLPANFVSWNNLDAFLTKLNEELRLAPRGWRFALPTEAQWEYACRAGTTKARYGKLDEIAWTDDERRPVGLKKPNPWGFYDMIGNVGEWVADWFGDYPKGRVVDPTGPASGERRVYRGSDWKKDAENFRAARRIELNPDYGGTDVGVRLALVPEP